MITHPELALLFCILVLPAALVGLAISLFLWKKAGLDIVSMRVALLALFAVACTTVVTFFLWVGVPALSDGIVFKSILRQMIFVPAIIAALVSYPIVTWIAFKTRRT
ncbi:MULTISPECIES: hypothetical protein [Dyella]|uniref:Uncharacterized protein n=2 Tax=Dyella TaxID=231454 RepID=A0A4R0YXU9_9GAMM|nr:MULTISPECIES: hypothetical protein [Dyella]TBR40600.1 hypothetical protein EYV96_10725 [Dyella terrae]TCI11818.1 hypothetical protein EZM97_00145 [Dyella soli]